MSFHRFVAELPLITLTLWLQSAGVAALIAWVRRALREICDKWALFVLPRWLCDWHCRSRCSARDGDSAVGMLLSLAVPTVMGFRDLLLRKQLFDARL